MAKLIKKEIKTVRGGKTYLSTKDFIQFQENEQVTLNFHKNDTINTQPVQAIVVEETVIPKQLGGTSIPQSHLTLKYIRNYFSDEKGHFSKETTERFYDCELISLPSSF